jgi:hypothetical protein
MSDELFNIPGEPGPNYPASPLTPQVDKAGKEFIAVNGRIVKNGPFGIRVYMRQTPTGKWNQLLFRQNWWGQLAVINGILYLYYTRPDWKVGRLTVPNWIKP